MAFVSACANTGNLIPVAPAISGIVLGDEVAEDSAVLVLTVVHRETLNIVGRTQTRVDPNGSFAFRPIERLVSGKERGRDYRVLLHLRVGGRTRVIWRVQYSLTELTESVELECDLGRSERIGQPCWVDDPAEQRWFLVEGERTYRRLCVGCHGIDGRGEIGVEAGQRMTPPDLRTIALRRGDEFDRTEIAAWIEGRSSPKAHGPRDMPIWGEELQVEYALYANPDAMIGATLDPLVAYLEFWQETE
jgi:hypothetical protein